MNAPSATAANIVAEDDAQPLRWRGYPDCAGQIPFEGLANAIDVDRRRDRAHESQARTHWWQTGAFIPESTKMDSGASRGSHATKSFRHAFHAVLRRSKAWRTSNNERPERHVVRSDRERSRALLGTALVQTIDESEWWMDHGRRHGSRLVRKSANTCSNSATLPPAKGPATITCSFRGAPA